MNSSGDAERDAEARRVGRIYDGYRRSRRRSRAWAADNPGNQAIRAELLSAVLEEAGPELQSGGEVIDVGCGTGYWLETLANAGVRPDRLTGVDILSERVAAAANRMPGATVRRADARALPFEDGRFDVVLLFTVLSSLATPEDVRLALVESRRVLRDGGLLLCYEPRISSPLSARTLRIGDELLGSAGIHPRAERHLTVLPQVARRLGRWTPHLYPWLLRIGPMRTHRLITYRAPARG